MTEHTFAQREEIRGFRESFRPPRRSIADAPHPLDALEQEACIGHPSEETAASRQSDATDPYLDAIGASAEPDASSQVSDAEHANPYMAALGVDAPSPSDTPVLDPTTLDDPSLPEYSGSDAPNDQAETDLPVDDPIVPLPEEDDTSTNSG